MQGTVADKINYLQHNRNEQKRFTHRYLERFLLSRCRGVLTREYIAKVKDLHQNWRSGEHIQRLQKLETYTRITKAQKLNVPM